METEISPSPGSLIERSVENLVTVLGVWHPRLGQRRIHAGVSDALVVVLATLLVQGIGLRMLDPLSTINIDTLNGYTGGIGLSLISLAVGLFLVRRGSDIPEVAVGVLWSLLLGGALSIGAYSVIGFQGTFDWVLRGVVVTYIIPVVFLGFRLGWLQSVAVSAVFLIPAVLSAGALLSYYLGPDDNDVAYVPPPDTEMIYAAQAELLGAQIETLRPSDPGKVELFAVLGAGYPYEGVFRREVESVSTQLAERFDAEDRVIRLVNSVSDHMEYPLLNRGNLSESLAAIAEKMDDDDLLLLFLTSHGNVRTLSTEFQGVVGRNLSPRDIAKALDGAGINHTIIAVSACYSGSFVDALAGPGRLVLTAADAESTSFGCNDKNQWTEWGRAFFDDALNRTRDPREAARIAQETVAQLETRDGRKPSSPQILEGNLIGAAIDRWLMGFDDAAQN